MSRCFLEKCQPRAEGCSVSEARATQNPGPESNPGLPREERAHAGVISVLSGRQDGQPRLLWEVKARGDLSQRQRRLQLRNGT